LNFLGLLLQGGGGKPKNIRILGVLQRLALCYFFTATLVLIFNDVEDECNSAQWPIGKIFNKIVLDFFNLIDLGNDVHQPLRQELNNTVFYFWQQWLCIFLITLAWLLITLVPKIGDCPRGYLGPGGKHYYRKYENCTGGKRFIIHGKQIIFYLFILGVAGYLDRRILGSSHIYDGPTCKDIYDTKVPYDPEGQKKSID
jgi:heparan-alpha-glucosaminide N-acetyltransferase